jgi:hypothetical protein
MRDCVADQLGCVEFRYSIRKGEDYTASGCQLKELPKDVNTPPPYSYIPKYGPKE